MLPLSLSSPGDAPLNVLCLGAHCDDIEIGCCGTLLSILENDSNVNVYWQVFCSSPARAAEANDGAKRFCEKAGNLDINILGFRDGFLPCEGREVKEQFEVCKETFEPDVVFTHYRDDRHQDHRLVSDLTWNTYRNHLILEYEIPKWDGDLGVPNTYVTIDDAIAARKIDTLLSVYASQQGKGWFTEDLFRSMLRIRGMECNSPSNLAEAFHARKTSLNISA